MYSSAGPEFTEFYILFAQFLTNFFEFTTTDGNGLSLVESERRLAYRQSRCPCAGTKGTTGRDRPGNVPSYPPSVPQCTSPFSRLLSSHSLLPISGDLFLLMISLFSRRLLRSSLVIIFINETIPPSLGSGGASGVFHPSSLSGPVLCILRGGCLSKSLLWLLWRMHFNVIDMRRVVDGWLWSLWPAPKYSRQSWTVNLDWPTGCSPSSIPVPVSDPGHPRQREIALFHYIASLSLRTERM